jgi:hypothetical protein
MIGEQGARLLENEIHIFFVRYKAAEAFLVLRDQWDRRDHSRRVAARGLTAHPAESEYSRAEINHLQEQQRLRKQYFL